MERVRTIFEQLYGKPMPSFYEGDWVLNDFIRLVLQTEGGLDEVKAKLEEERLELVKKAEAWFEANLDPGMFEPIDELTDGWPFENETSIHRVEEKDEPRSDLRDLPLDGLHNDEELSSDRSGPS